MRALLRRRLDLWLPGYLLGAVERAAARARRRRQLTHILFLVCDHFEPRHGIASDHQADERVCTWRREYASFHARLRARFGAAPLHTWFYPPHHGVQHLAALSEMVYDGLGEVELHYHHSDDTAETLRRALRSVVAEYQRWGFLLESGSPLRTAFGFIHGDWALDNSANGRYCGVNGELSILQGLGCWGDFTMPSGNACQTRKINSIYYAVDDPRRSKSHDRGTDARVGRQDPPGMFLMQGPLGVNWRAPGGPRIENGSLTAQNWGRPDRVRQWLDCNVHVRGRPDWLFVKLHTHGAIERDFDALFGGKAEEMHRLLNERFNDGQRYRLHYVTARQAYNIAKAAEHGMTGSPSDWRDYRIAPPPHAFYSLDAGHDLRHCTADRLTVENVAPAASVRLRTRIGPVQQLEGALRAVDIDAARGTVRLEARSAGSEIKLRADRRFTLERIEGGSVLPAEIGPGAWCLALGERREMQLRVSGAAPQA